MSCHPAWYAFAVFAIFWTQPAPAAPVQPPPPAFPTRAELVTVDVLVLDRQDKPASGLKREDFKVLEDGRPQAITAFEAVEAKLPALEAPETVASPSLSRVATNVARPPTRRTFAIVFDDLHVDDLNLEQAKRAMAAFVGKRTYPGDRLVLLTVSDGRFWATTRGSEDAVWLERLKDVRSHQRLKSSPACRVGEYEAMRIDEFDDTTVCQMVKVRLAALGCTEGTVVCRGGGSGDLAREVRAAGRVSLGRSLRMLKEVARSLSSVPGRKEAVLVSEGFIADSSEQGFREVREEAARANVVVHFLDARGLAVGPEFVTAAGARGTPQGPELGLSLALWRLEDAGTKALAEETGGLVLQTNDLVAGLERVADESRVMYLLGYEPTNTKRDGRYRKLKIEVLRPGLHVRARAGYFAPQGREKPAPPPDPIARAIRDPFDSDGIPLRLAAYVMGRAEGAADKPRVEVLVAGEMRLDALEARLVEDRRVAEPKLTLLTGSREGEWHKSEWTLAVTLAEAADRNVGDELWHPFLTRIAMEPGDRRARLVVQSGGRIGSVTTDFVVPRAGEERVSTAILSDRLVSGAGGRRVMPIVRRTFDASGTLHCWIELYGAAVGTQTGQLHATTSFGVRSSDGQEWATAPAAAMQEEGGRLVRLVSIPLAQAPAGENELLLTVRDDVSGRSFEIREPFRVEAASR